MASTSGTMAMTQPTYQGHNPSPLAPYYTGNTQTVVPMYYAAANPQERREYVKDFKDGTRFISSTQEQRRSRRSAGKVESPDMQISVHPGYTDALSVVQREQPRAWVTVPVKDGLKRKFRPRGFSLTETQSSGSSNWSTANKYMMAVRSGPTELPDHILAKHPLFPRNDFPSPYTLFFFDETAPNPILLRNDLKMDVAKKDRRQRRHSTGSANERTTRQLRAASDDRFESEEESSSGGSGSLGTRERNPYQQPAYAVRAMPVPVEHANVIPAHRSSAGNATRTSSRTSSGTPTDQRQSRGGQMAVQTKPRSARRCCAGKQRGSSFADERSDRRGSTTHSETSSRASSSSSSSSSSEENHSCQYAAGTGTSKASGGKVYAVSTHSSAQPSQGYLTLPRSRGDQCCGMRFRQRGLVLPASEKQRSQLSVSKTSPVYSTVASSSVVGQHSISTPNVYVHVVPLYSGHHNTTSFPSAHGSNTVKSMMMDPQPTYVSSHHAATTTSYQTGSYHGVNPHTTYVMPPQLIHAQAAAPTAGSLSLSAPFVASAYSRVDSQDTSKPLPTTFPKACTVRQICTGPRRYHSECSEEDTYAPLPETNATTSIRDGGADNHDYEWESGSSSVSSRSSSSVSSSNVSEAYYEKNTMTSSYGTAQDRGSSAKMLNQRKPHRGKGCCRRENEKDYETEPQKVQEISRASHSNRGSRRSSRSTVVSSVSEATSTTSTDVSSSSSDESSSCRPQTGSRHSRREKEHKRKAWCRSREPEKANRRRGSNSEVVTVSSNADRRSPRLDVQEELHTRDSDTATVYKNPFVHGTADDLQSLSSDSTLYKLYPTEKHMKERKMDFHLRKFYFEADDIRLPRKGTAYKMLPMYSTSYRNYPTIAYDVVAPVKYTDFFTERKAPTFWV